MRITISHNDHNIYLMFPTRVLCSRTAVRILNHFMRKHSKGAIPYIPPAYARALYKEIKKSKKRYGRNWAPIEMESSGGDAVRIRF